MKFKNILNCFILLYLFNVNFVFASNKYDSKIDISMIIFFSCIVIFNLICSKDDKKHKMILTNILKFSLKELEINYVITNVVRLIFILAYYFFVIPIIIDFFIAFIQILYRNIKSNKKRRYHKAK